MELDLLLIHLSRDNICIILHKLYTGFDLLSIAHDLNKCPQNALSGMPDVGIVATILIRLA
jgi:hypothetical protein